MDEWKLPAKLQISDPEVLARAEQMQTELKARANSPFANLSPAEHARVRAITISDEIREALTGIEQQIGEAITSGGPLEELQKARYSLNCQLAEQYAVIGRFDLAAQADPREEQKKEYLEILKAINRDDKETCLCADNREYVQQDVFSFRHNRIVSLIRCTGCGLRNAKDLPKHLSKQRTHRSKAAMMAAHLSPSEAAEILRREGHTSRELLK